MLTHLQTKAPTTTFVTTTTTNMSSSPSLRPPSPFTLNITIVIHPRRYSEARQGEFSTWLLYRESAVGLGSDAIRVRLVDDKFIQLEGEDFVFDVSGWVMKEGK